MRATPPVTLGPTSSSRRQGTHQSIFSLFKSLILLGASRFALPCRLALASTFTSLPLLRKPCAPVSLMLAAQVSPPRLSPRPGRNRYAFSIYRSSFAIYLVSLFFGIFGFYFFILLPTQLVSYRSKRIFNIDLGIYVCISPNSSLSTTIL